MFLKYVFFRFVLLHNHIDMNTCIYIAPVKQKSSEAIVS